MKAKVFVGSSTKGLQVAEAVQQELSHDCEAVLWTQGVFRKVRVPLENLMRAVEEFDFAVFVLLPEDPLTIRDKETMSVRDNVLFELGLFLGKLGRERNFFITPRHEPPVDLHLPTDLSGITPAPYDEDSTNLRATVGAALYEMKDAIRSLGKANQIVLYSSRNGLKRQDFSHENGCFWDKDGKPSSPRSEGSLDFVNKTIEIKRTTADGRYEIHFRFNGPRAPSIAAKQRTFWFRCEGKVDRGERTLRLVLKNEKTNKWLASDQKVINTTNWMNVESCLQVSGDVGELLFRIDDERPSQAPSTLWLQNLALAEET